MQIIGITGRSGCGKSTLTDSIRAAGFRCVDADQVARDVLLPGSPCIVQLQQEFGADIVDEAGQVRRRLLADRAFATPPGHRSADRHHPAGNLPSVGSCYGGSPAGGGKALLCGRRGDRGYPVPKAVQPSRLVAAPYEPACSASVRGMALRRKLARRRLDAQLPETVLRAAADFVIEIDGTLQQMQQRCNALLTALRKEAYGETSDEK